MRVKVSMIKLGRGLTMTIHRGRLIGMVVVNFYPVGAREGVYLFGLFIYLFIYFLILRRMGKNKDLAHRTSTYFHTRRVSI